jgi:hypothetical protein
MNPLWVVAWIAFGLLNLEIMKRADSVCGGYPPGGVYWIKGRERLAVIGSFLGGFMCLPFTIMAFLDWYELKQ